ncbi:MAG: 3-deoxy-manno-octulosonate cytidylyltransferase [Spirochaetaceae bacterium]|nr:MAG: 3-deoxy-manno-octulosonate cytidylyltransferase [Spirochaetaceae bacterium]
MNTIGIIPARYASTRLPGKPLKDICGKPMIQHVYERVMEARLIDDVVVATDDRRIADAVNEFGGRVVLTREDHPNGTSRAAEVVAAMDVDIVVNIQGDEPLIRSEMIDELAQVMIDDRTLTSATLCYRIPPDQHANPGVVKVVRDHQSYALYFSRSLIPYPRNAEDHRVYEHIGIYAYTRPFLLTYSELSDTPLCITESLEQLKILEHGYRMKVIETRVAYEALSVDTEEDLERVRELVAGEIDQATPSA